MCKKTIPKVIIEMLKGDRRCVNLVKKIKCSNLYKFIF